MIVALEDLVNSNLRERDKQFDELNSMQNGERK
jgi:hypothetical protein